MPGTRNLITRATLPGVLAVGLLAVCAWGPVVATAAELSLPPTLCGHDEREEGAGACPHETAFKAGIASPDLHLKIGGQAWGCDAEWATSLEFDLGALPSGTQVYSAMLVVRKTGYSDDSEGFTYLGAYAYQPTGSEVVVERAAVTPDTALDIVYPSAANTDLSFDVTAAVQAWVLAGVAKGGFLLAPVYPEIGYEDWISVGGCGYVLPPRLVVVHEGAVAGEATSWSQLKATYR